MPLALEIQEQNDDSQQFNMPVPIILFSNHHCSTAWTFPQHDLKILHSRSRCTSNLSLSKVDRPSLGTSPVEVASITAKNEEGKWTTIHNDQQEIVAANPNCDNFTTWNNTEHPQCGSAIKKPLYLKELISLPMHVSCWIINQATAVYKLIKKVVINA